MPKICIISRAGAIKNQWKGVIKNLQTQNIKFIIKSLNCLLRSLIIEFGGYQPPLPPCTRPDY